MGFHDDLVRFHGDLIVTIGMKGIIITIFSVELAFFIFCSESDKIVWDGIYGEWL
jgi:hypothetical protein